MLLWHRCVQIFLKLVFSYPLNLFSEVELLGHRVVLFLVFWEFLCMGFEKIFLCGDWVICGGLPSVLWRFPHLAWLDEGTGVRGTKTSVVEKNSCWDSLKMKFSISLLPSLDFFFNYEEAVEAGLEGKPGLPGQHPPKSCLHLLVLQTVDKGVQ